MFMLSVILEDYFGNTKACSEHFMSLLKEKYTNCVLDVTSLPLLIFEPVDPHQAKLEDKQELKRRLC